VFYTQFQDFTQSWTIVLIYNIVKYVWTKLSKTINLEQNNPRRDLNYNYDQWVMFDTKKIMHKQVNLHFSLLI